MAAVHDRPGLYLGINTYQGQVTLMELEDSLGKKPRHLSELVPKLGLPNPFY